jgi:hypothetical protein
MNFSYINLLIFVIKKKSLKKMSWKEPMVKTHFDIVNGDILHITPHIFNKFFFQTLKNDIKK